MTHRTGTCIGRIVATVALAAIAWLAVGSTPAAAVPGQAMVEYGGTLEAGRAASGTNNSVSDDGFSADTAREFAEDNAPFLIVGVGALMVVGTWKFITR